MAMPAQREQASREVQPTDTMNSITSPSDASSSVGRSLIRTIVVFSAVVAPVAFVPYILVRQRLLRHDARLAHMHALNARLANELKAARGDIAKFAKEAAERSDAALQKTRTGLAELRDAVGAEGQDVRQHVSSEVSKESRKLSGLLTSARKVAEEREGTRRAWEEEMRGNMSILLQENLASRTQFAAELKELGQSLADTAAFIQEVEMRQGWPPRPADGRGIERTRRLAQRLQDFAAAMETQQSATPPRRYTSHEACNDPYDGKDEGENKTQ
ncbi:hypothetical protein BN946_scf184858.g46 [Trametes cinnabarina]|uniref:Uncharacterized protein n=1 Tax=Pycnoporus cinnabarinus TaxID=5643 RepID=A0A060SN33_PYCCI|nr:hypothetical protein BN946_scf184858.g46 [Trametes cinnabarina]